MSDAETTGLRTLVVGIDGVCSSVLAPLIDDGLLPNIESIQASGAVGPLESQLPPWTPSAWPSIYTGKNPGKHGVYDFLQFDGYDWDLVNRSTVNARAVWELLSMQGYTSVVVNVPVTHPPRASDATVVPGYLAPEPADCYPPGTWDELVDELGEYRLYADSRYREASKADRLDSYNRLTRMRGAAFRYLLADREPAFGFVQFQQTDTVYHEYPDDKAMVRSVYRTVDDEIGKILQACDPQLLLVVSDHGLGPMDREFRVNEFLRDQEVLETTAGTGGMPSWSSLAETHLQNGDSTGSSELSAAERAIELAASVGLPSQRLLTAVRQLGLEDQLLELVPSAVVRANSERVDFADSRAYMRSRTELGIRLNVEGREPDGVVAENEYESVRAELIETLQSVRTPSGERCFEQVLPRETVFDGPYVDQAPDIVIVPASFKQYLSGSLGGDWFDKPADPWEHNREGIVMAAGETVDSETDTAGHIFDVAPTVLASFGLAVDREMDGDPLPVVSPTGRCSYPPLDPDQPVGTVEHRFSE